MMLPAMAVRRLCGVLLGAAAVGCGGTAGRPQGGYGVAIVNNTGDTMFRCGWDFGTEPVVLREQMGDGAYGLYAHFPDPIPEEAVVFWEAPLGTPHRRVVPVRPHVPTVDKYFNLYFAVRADGGVDVTGLTHAAAQADGAAAFKEVRRRGRPADRPEPPPLGD